MSFSNLKFNQDPTAPEGAQMVGIADLYIEVHHNRGDVTKFETYDVQQKTWAEAPVWDLRKLPETVWRLLFITERAAKFTHDTVDSEMETQIFRVTRTKSAEKEVDSTYHPSVESWKIDKNKVEEHFAREMGH